MYPALAVVEALRDASQPHDLCWAGSVSGVERDLVARLDVPFNVVPSGQISGVGLKALVSVFDILRGIFAALRLIRRFRPQVVLITGGYVTFPVALAARLRRIPLLILLPDIEPGSTIKALSRLATRVATVSDVSNAAFRPGVAVETGYPVRRALVEATQRRDEALAYFELAASLPTLLVFGGSHGARSINQALMAALPDLLDICQVLHISGNLDWDWVKTSAGDLPKQAAGRYHPYAYLHEEMGLALAAADVVVSRAGAGTLGEFPLFALPAILVPYPHAWHYQKVNAGFLVKHGAARQLDDATLNTSLLPAVRDLLLDETARQTMSAQAAVLAKADAAQRVVEQLRAIALKAEESL